VIANQNIPATWQVLLALSFDIEKQPEDWREEERN
jgi:hypothetical protein